MLTYTNTALLRVQKFWNSRPCNIRHSTKEVGTREYFDEVEKRKYFVEPHIPLFADFERWKGKKVLEIGCGIGTDTINFARAGAEVTAVDFSEKSLEIAKKRAEIYESKITFYHANAEDLSSVVPMKTFDLVYSFGVIHHTPHPEKVIAEIKKCMTPAGTLKIMVYHRFSWKVLWILLTYGKGAFWDLDSLISEYSEAQTGCPVTYTYSKRDMAALLKGFTIEKIAVDHIFPYTIEDYKKYVYNKEWYFNIMPAWFFRYLEKHFGWHVCVDAKLDVC
jgi:2-polyprenyl-3-methyl-5-hydroxy-6-metoxy-1,4-benzoquinol methylase